MIRSLDIRRWSPVLRIFMFIILLVVLLWSELSKIPARGFDVEDLFRIAIIFSCLAVGVFFIYRRIIRIAWHYAGVLYKLDEEQAVLFTSAIMGQIYPQDMPRFILQVGKGRVNPESSEMVKKIGGPGFVSVESNHVVITSRFGVLYRSLGADFHKLHPFEKVWDVIDLRPQHRELTVNFMTADGIPAQCTANITFRVATPRQENAFRLATSKYVKSASGRNRISDWTNGIAGGAFDGDIRNTLERYFMDELVNPLSLYPSDHVPAPAPLVSLTELEDQIRTSVVATGEERGIDVMHIELSDIKPTEAVLRAWYKLWEANKLYMPRMQMAEQDAIQSQKALNTYAKKRARLVELLGDRANSLTQQGQEVLATMVRTGILDAVLDLDEAAPRVKVAVLDRFGRDR